MSLSPNSVLLPAFPEIAMRERQNRKTYMYLCQSLQNVYSHVNVIDIINPSCFYEVSYESSLSAIDSTLMASLNSYQQIQKYLMLAIQDACPPEQTRVYTTDLSQTQFNFIEGDNGVWSQNFLFYNIFKHKILIFALKAVPEQIKESAYDENMQEEDYDGYNELLNEGDVQEAFPQGSKFFCLL
uniref:Maf1 regulator n=1 Tax=Trepomonas sp. PC1 TaxID=1076344 RepID=A0A146KE25_9EUKA|eukprot:JAP93701.1 hypothetical protein TPC1_13919 [Trepomonas sp. PC1]